MTNRELFKQWADDPCYDLPPAFKGAARLLKSSDEAFAAADALGERIERLQAELEMLQQAARHTRVRAFQLRSAAAIEAVPDPDGEFVEVADAT